jgi:small subunit ribosomal protein S5
MAKKKETKKVEETEEISEEVKIPEVIEEVKPEEVKRVLTEEERRKEQKLAAWKPRTKLGKDVFERKINNVDEILDSGVKIKEPQIVDFLIPDLQSELIMIGGRPGKGGGAQRTPIRISAKMHKSGRRYTSTAFAVVGNNNGIVGIGKGRGKEGRLAVDKAIEKAKLNIIKVPRGCGSWECGCEDPHSIPFRAEGKAASVSVKLLPAPKGIGLATDDETKKILRLAGIKDVWIKTLGETGTRVNLIKAIFNALKNLHSYRTGE